MRLSHIEVARRAFLLVIAQRSSGTVARSYLTEKITTVYSCTEVDQIRNLLDLNSRAVFNNILDETHAPKKP